jgi:NAD(P)-dependent dehydrogenase (short-subunit alcohol dehydrogenase family)
MNAVSSRNRAVLATSGRDVPPAGPAALEGKIAVVTGATRGVGKGIALALGSHGAVVYVTGRSTQDETNDRYASFLAASGLKKMPGSVEQTVEEIVAAGGTAHAFRCDHREVKDVEALTSDIRTRYGKIDILVNNAWGGHETFSPNFDTPFWKQDLRQWDSMLYGGVRNGILTTHVAYPLLCRANHALIVFTTFCDEGKYLKGNFFYDLAKSAINRAAFGIGQELQVTRLTSVAISPGFVKTELVEAMIDSSGGNGLDHGPTESPRFIGRGIVALANDTRVHELNGKTVTAAALSSRYGFTDVDGARPTEFHVP